MAEEFIAVPEPGIERADETAQEPEVVVAEAQVAPATETAPEEVQEWRDRYTRLLAEFENFKRRTNREKEDILRYGGESLATALLPVLDDLARTLKAAHASDNLEAIRNGVSLIEKKFRDALQRQGIEAIPAVGEAFSAEVHEALGAFPTEDEAKKGTVLEEVETGYRYKGKVIRYAKVITGE